MLAIDAIEPVQTGWASPLVFIPKKDETLGISVRSRKLNPFRMWESYTILHMDYCIDSLGRVAKISTLHAKCGLCRVESADEDRDETAFTSHYGLFQFTCMPFGWKNASGMFQRTVDILLLKVKWPFALVYLDDIFIFSLTPDKRIGQVRQVLTLLHEEGMTLNWKKS